MISAAPKTGKRGDPMEYLAALVFQAQGYLVRRAVPLQYEPQGTAATDIDLVGIRFTQPFQVHRIICDCKNRQRSRPYERIFWAKGLGSFVHASEIYVCLPRANVDVVKFAKSGQVRVLTEDALRSAAGNSQPYSLANPRLVERLRQSVAVGLKKDRQAATLLAQTRRLYLSDDPYVALNIVMVNLRQAAHALRLRAATADESHDLWRVIAGELIVLIPLLLLGMASDTLGLPSDQRRRHIVERLTYGDLPPQKAEEIFDLARQVAQEASRATNPQLPLTAPLPFDLGKIDPPDYAQDVSGLVDRAVLNPPLYLALPAIMDYLVFEQAIQNAAFAEADYRAAFPGPMQDEKLKVARNVFTFARDRGELDLAAFWPKQEGNLPKASVVTDPGTATSGPLPGQ
jgi:hypothetical protein